MKIEELKKYNCYTKEDSHGNKFIFIHNEICPPRETSCVQEINNFACYDKGDCRFYLNSILWFNEEGIRESTIEEKEMIRGELEIRSIILGDYYSNIMSKEMKCYVRTFLIGKYLFTCKTEPLPNTLINYISLYDPEDNRLKFYDSFFYYKNIEGGAIREAEPYERMMFLMKLLKYLKEIDHCLKLLNEQCC